VLHAHSLLWYGWILFCLGYADANAGTIPDVDANANVNAGTISNHDIKLFFVSVLDTQASNL
jgi:hypothetical protein